MLKTKIKAAAITNLTDARYFAAREVEWLGFNFELGTSHYIQPVAMKAIKEWVDGVKIVGEFGTHPVEEIKKAIEVLELDFIQVGLFTTVEDVINLQGTTIIREIVIEKSTTEADIEEQIEEFAAYVDIFLLDFSKNDIHWEDLKEGEHLAIPFLKRLCSECSVLLTMDLSADNVIEILEVLKPHGLQVKGGEEEQVGLKSFDELDDILDVLEIYV